jgi:hypothetical protein
MTTVARIKDARCLTTGNTRTQPESDWPERSGHRYSLAIEKGRFPVQRRAANKKAIHKRRASYVGTADQQQANKIQKLGTELQSQFNAEMGSPG